MKVDLQLTSRGRYEKRKTPCIQRTMRRLPTQQINEGGPDEAQQQEQEQEQFFHP